MVGVCIYTETLGIWPESRDDTSRGIISCVCIAYVVVGLLGEFVSNIFTFIFTG